MKVIETYQELETFQLGVTLGKTAKKGEVYVLSGGLGVGKTVFSRGFATGLGVKELVDSPTFTIVKVYEEGRLPFYHFDVYRIGDLVELEEIGYEEYVYGDGVSLIEWGERLREELPPRYIKIIIQKQMEKGFDYRKIEIVSV